MEGREEGREGMDRRVKGTLRGKGGKGRDAKLG